MHPLPLQLHVRHFQSYLLPRRTYRLPAGTYDVAIDETREYVIGVMIFIHLCPLMAPRVDNPSTYERVKVRIHMDDAEEYVPISTEDPLNHLFFNEYEGQVRAAIVHEEIS